jgi:hypothetical protein
MADAPALGAETLWGMRLVLPGPLIPPFPAWSSSVESDLRQASQRSDHETVPVPLIAVNDEIYSTREGVKAGEELVANL